MNAAMVKKAKAARDKQRAEFAAQVVRVTPKVSIHRLDAFNWQIRGMGGTRENYFCSLASALEALPAKLLDSEAAGAVADVIAFNRRIREEVLTAIESARRANLIREYGK